MFNDDVIFYTITDSEWSNAGDGAQGKRGAAGRGEAGMEDDARMAVLAPSCVGMGVNDVMYHA